MNSPDGCILLVEDDALLRHAFRLLLEDAGYSVVEAGSVKASLEVVEQETPALVLLDLGLPDGPGLDLARKLRGRPETADIPIVALTGRSGPHEERACIEAGCSHYFAKPLEPRRFLERLPDLIRSEVPDPK